MICTIGVFLLGLDLLVQKPWTSVAGALIMFGLSILFSASYKKHVKETAEKMNKISLEKEDGTKSTT